MRLEGEEWRRLMAGFARSAFRLETLPFYDMPGERDEFARHLAGEQPPPDLHYRWLDTVAAGRKAGKTFQRVHVITPPLSDYLYYEFAWGYAFNVAAGEDIRIIDLSLQPNPGLPQQDFWLFDDTTVVRMDYRPGTQIGRELLEDADPVPYVAWKQLALRDAHPFTEYYATLHG